MAATEKKPEELEKARQLNSVPWCDEYEKMISGMLYNAFVPELEASRFYARKWSMHYNTYFPQDPAATAATVATERLELLRSALGFVADDEACIDPPFQIDYGRNIRLGKRFYANFGFTVLDCALVTIGDRVMCGTNVSIITATHETEVESRRRNIEYAKPIVIGDDCWIGANSVILPGVTIGKGCTVGAGAIVTKDVPDWSVVMGVPARVVKKVQPVPDEEPVN